MNHQGRALIIGRNQEENTYDNKPKANDRLEKLRIPFIFILFGCWLPNNILRVDFSKRF